MKSGAIPLALPGADVRYHADWIAPGVATEMLAALLREVPYAQHFVRMFGREMPAPRLSAWIGDPDAIYTYSRVRYEPTAWTPTLTGLRVRLQGETGALFNSVLVNRYRSGADSMGWHADDEPELGAEPLIASVSLGASRRLRFRARKPGGQGAGIDLESGSLLLMSGRTQQLYQHALDKTKAPTGERINLTFRLIAPRSA